MFNLRICHLVGKVQASETHPLLRDDEYVGGCRRVDVLEREALFVFVNAV